MPKTLLPIIELYKAVQAEGSMSGRVNILVRTTGCTHRCCFTQGQWCDTWYSSIHPEKGRFCWEEIEAFFTQHRGISNLMITGGSPTMHPHLVSKLVSYFCSLHGDKAFITLETEGSAFVGTSPPIHLISLSPKLSNSVPQVGSRTPLGTVVDEKFVAQHNKHRFNYSAMRALIHYHQDYHLKFVVDRADADPCAEIDQIQAELGAARDKIWLMPAGDNWEHIRDNYAFVMGLCVEKNYNFSGRPHIIAFGNKRET